MNYYIRVTLLSCGIRVYKVAYRKWYQFKERDFSVDRYWSEQGARMQLEGLTLVNKLTFNVTF